jgi:outer membrane protein assembly factor BamB
VRHLGRSLIGLLLLVPASPAVAGRTLPCVEHDLVDGRCEAWAANHDADGGDDIVYDMAVSPDGTTVYGAGHAVVDGAFKALAVAYDAATGERRWAAIEGRDGDAYDPFVSLAVAPDGESVYAAGAACTDIRDGSTCDVLLSAFDADDGTTAWSVVWNGAGNDLDSAQGVVATADVVYVGGQTYSGRSGLDYLVAAFDAGSGEELWTARYDGPAGIEDRGAALARAGDLIVLTGRSGTSIDDEDIATVAFDTREDHEGEIRWAARLDGGVDAFSIAAAAGRLVVAGERTTPFGARGPVAVGYDAATGQRLWVERYDDPGIAGGSFFDAALTPDGTRAVVTGYTQRSDGKGPSTLALDAATGQRLWAANLQEGLGYAVAPSADGRRVYMTGVTYTRRGPMHRTVSYAMTTGAQRWVGLYEQTAPPAGLQSTLILPSAIAISPDGTDVYVGGTTRGWLADHDDALVIAYKA